MGYHELMRRKLLEDIYDKMTDEEKRVFVQLTMQDRSSEEIMRKLEEIRHGQQSFLADYGSNLLANATWDSIIWLGSKLLKLR